MDDAEFVIADIPGLIEGASDGAGLGDRFLGHIERCAVLLHLIDGTSNDVLADYETIVGELEAYGGDLADKPRIVVVNKADALGEQAEDLVILLREEGIPIHSTISGVTGAGVTDVLRALRREILAARRAEAGDDDEDDRWRP